MKYADLSKYVRMLWSEARYGWALDPTYRAYVVGRVMDQLTIAGLLADDALDQCRDHLTFDYRLDPTEAGRFTFWWQHITEKGFASGNPLAHLHRGKVGVK
jgi:hypothetical protein